MEPIWASLIAAIKTPLAFFSLIALIIDASLVGLAVRFNSPNLGYAAVALLALLIIAVSVLILAGKAGMLVDTNNTSMNETFAVGLGEEFYTALQGYYDNLTPEERDDAYMFLGALLESSPHSHTSEQRTFCIKIAETVIRKANLTYRIRR